MLDMRDERIEGGTILRGVDFADGDIRCGVGAEAIDGFSWEGDEAAHAQNFRRGGEPRAIGLQIQSSRLSQAKPMVSIADRAAHAAANCSFGTIRQDGIQCVVAASNTTLLAA